MAFRIGVDIGGTFTDFALIDDRTGRTLTHKQLTTPADPATAFLEGIARLTDRAGIPVSEIDAVIHGTTLVTNALIERKGVLTGMVVTEGFRDTLDIARECRYDLFDLALRYPEPVVGRRHRFELPERIAYSGEVLTPLRLDGVAEKLRDFITVNQMQALAVCLLHSYANPLHEHQVGQWLRANFPNLYVSVSSDVFPFMREYERWTTTTLNAYVQPIVDRYLERLETDLAKVGFRGKVYIVSSSGGTLTPEVARRFPIRMLESGPAAGALMSARHGHSLGLGQLLSFDMGGTTAKGCIIRDAEPLKRYEFEVARVHEFKRGSGLPAKIPVIDMIEIGAGGGSIAAVDERGVLQVGPRSTGADPGPACYGRGGSLATLTDANLVLGYLDPASFLGGRMPISRTAAEAALRGNLGERLSTDICHVAWGIHEVVNEDVARAFRIHASERGIDYRRCSMVAFGGSGPIHALRVARKLRIPRVICPSGAGVMSAFGLLISPLSFEVAQSRRVSLGDIDAAQLSAIFGDLERDATQLLLDAGLRREQITIKRRLDMRYEGQGYEIEIAVPDAFGPDELFRGLPILFASEYRRLFSLAYPDKSIEVVNWKAEAVGPLPSVELDLVPPRQGLGEALKGTRPAFFDEAGGYVETPVIERWALQPGQVLDGPALIEERESTCVVGIGDRVTVDVRRNLVAEIGGGA